MWSLRREILIPEDDAPRMMRIAILESKIHEKQNRVDKAMETLAQTLLRLDKAEERDGIVGERVEVAVMRTRVMRMIVMRRRRRKKQEKTRKKGGGRRRRKRGGRKKKDETSMPLENTPTYQGLSEIPSHTKGYDELCRVYARHKKKDKVDLL